MVAESARPDRSIVFVTGSGRSGTSMFSGLLQRLGYTVPQPEVRADDSNPRGFAESRWVVDFHTRLLRTANVQVSDARPSAWSDALAVSNDTVAQELRTFLSGQFADGDHILVKDPRLMWFLPLWRRVAIDLGVAPRFVTMVRHPAEVVESKTRSYGPAAHGSGHVTRTAGWLNAMLYNERATRDGARAFVRYDDLLADWPKVIARVADELSLEPISTATAGQMREAEAFADPSLRRSSSSWEQLDIPAGMRELAEQVWELVSQLAEPGLDPAPSAANLDAARSAYVGLYEEAEAIAQSSIAAARRPSPGAAAQPAPQRNRTLTRRIWRRLPPGLRRAARPVRTRVAARRA